MLSFWRRIPKTVKWLLAIPLICGGICYATYWLIELRPQYVELNPPIIDDSQLSYSGHRSVVNTQWGDRYYVWRTETSCIKSKCGDRTDIINWFEQWLAQEGWAPDAINSNRCATVIPEVRFLNEGKNGYMVYHPADTEGWNFGASICLAVYSTSSDGRWWTIVIGTINPSPFTQWGDEFDSI